MALTIRTAEELIDPVLEARWAARRAGQQGPVLQRILRTFVERGGPVPAGAITAAIPHQPPEAMAYPFSAVRTPFVARLTDGRERYACCAIDALGIAAMLGEPVRFHSACHHCGMPLEFSAGPDGPGRDAEGLMVWIGERAEGQRRISTSL